MNEQELIAAVRPAGRYEVVSREDGSFVVIPVPAEAILITRKHSDNALSASATLTTDL